jgi:hypothetical protein
MNYWLRKKHIRKRRKIVNNKRGKRLIFKIKLTGVMESKKINTSSS